MNSNRIVLSLALALAAMLSTTGCRHGFNGKVTNLPGHNPETIANPPATTIPPGPSYEPTPTPVVNQNPITPGSIQVADFDITNYNQDRAALAAYTVHFKFDSSVVQDNEQANVTSVAQVLQGDQSTKLLIEGHCDERGTEEYNRSLGERRALALREALAKGNIDPMRVKTISYGKDKPADPGHDESAWAKNRRGEFILLRPKTPVQ